MKKVRDILEKPDFSISKAIKGKGKMRLCILIFREWGHDVIKLVILN